MKKFKFAFTLAEVLVTLGIIGVVAAMTIPTLSNNLRGKKLQSQFMKTYSDLNQAARNFYADNDMRIRDYQDSVYDGSWGSTDSLRLFMGYFKGQTSESNLTAKGFDQRNNIKNLNINNQEVNQYPCDQSAVFSDMVGRTYVMDDNAAYQNFSWGPKICVDINGKDRPNKWGVDRFVFVFTENNSVIPYTGTSWNSLGYMGSTEEYLTQFCSVDSTDVAHVCAYFALKNISPDGKGDYWHDFLRGK
ncbi:MAG: type II secretion system GspH family protein [Muribaculaceae bacterium]|nr:type II secretion system GspH family protein [Muribaculaceae bacterium]